MKMTKEEYQKYFGGKIKGNIQQAIAPHVASALTDFCNQEPEFEQAIVQSEKSFQECLDFVAEGVGKSISDIEVYGKAVKFYFSTATVSFIMRINLSGNNEAPPITMTENSETKNDILSVSLDDLLDF